MILGGHFDVSAKDKRITELENYKIDNYLCLEDLIMLLNLNNESGYTRKYAYKIDECDYVEETFTIKYTTSLTDTFLTMKPTFSPGRAFLKASWYISTDFTSVVTSDWSKGDHLAT